MVRDLAPAELAGDPDEPALPAALRQTCERLGSHGTVDVRVQVHGTPVQLDPEIETALLRTARGALANVLEHAGATTAVVTLTYQPDAVTLDVRDDGRGLPADRRTRRPGPGQGARRDPRPRPRAGR